MAALLRLLGLARRSWALCDGRRGGAAHTAWISVVSVSAQAHRAVVRVLGGNRRFVVRLMGAGVAWGWGKGLGISDFGGGRGNGVWGTLLAGWRERIRWCSDGGAEVLRC